MTNVTVTTANICGNPIRARRAVRKRMRQALQFTGVTFGQEVAQSNHFRIGRGNYSHAWHGIATSLGKTTEGGPKEVPISLPRDYEVLSAEARLMHKGKRMVSPNRFATIVTTIHGYQKVAFVNCHTVSKPRRWVPFSRWRIKNFNIYLDKLSGIVEELHSQGFTVVFGGDMNHKSPMPVKIHLNQRVLVSSGLDHLWIVLAKSVALEHVNHTSISRTALMDHPILTVSFDLTNAK